MNKFDSAIGAYDDDFEEENNVAMVDLLITLAKYKKFIIGSVVCVAISAAAISLAFPDKYRANTRLLPPQQAQTGASALLSQLGGVAGAMAGSAGLKNPNDLYVGMLKSRTIANKLAEKYHLGNAYDLSSTEKIRKRLEENTSISAGKDGLITIEVEDREPVRAAQIANGYVAELQQLTRVLAVTEASQRRLFFEQQLEQAKNNLAAAEMKFKEALSTRGVISVDSESRAVLETLGRLRAQVSAKEIQLNSMAAFVTTSNPEYRRVQQDLVSLRSELSKLENGQIDGPSHTEGKKQTGLENIKVLRDVKYYQMLYELLSKQYEAARLDEAKDASTIQVLDPAMTPERKFAPKRAIIVALSTLIALLGAVGLAVFLESRLHATRSPEEDAKWNELKTLLGLKK